MIDKSKKNFSFRYWCRAILIGISFSAVVCVLSILIISLILALIKTFSEILMVPLALICVTLGVFCGAWLTAKITRCKGLVTGVIIGLLMFLVLTALGFIFTNSYFGTVSWIKLALLMCAGGAGGYFGMFYPKRRK